MDIEALAEASVEALAAEAVEALADLGAEALAVEERVEAGKSRLSVKFCICLFVFRSFCFYNSFTF